MIPVLCQLLAERFGPLPPYSDALQHAALNPLDLPLQLCQLLTELCLFLLSDDASAVILQGEGGAWDRQHMGRLRMGRWWRGAWASRAARG